MIVYGSRASSSRGVKIKPACTSCGQEGTVSMFVSYRYAHVFWIPMFPIGKKGYTECSHCKHVLEAKQFPEGYKPEYTDLKAETKRPVWHFAGILLIVAASTIGFFNYNKNKANTAEWIEAPMVGDIYEIKHDSKSYTLLKVAEVNGDTISLNWNLYEVNRRSGLDDDDMTGAENFSDSVYVLTISELKELREEGTIIDIDRD